MAGVYEHYKCPVTNKTVYIDTEAMNGTGFYEVVEFSDDTISPEILFAIKRDDVPKLIAQLQEWMTHKPEDFDEWSREALEG